MGEHRKAKLFTSGGSQAVRLPKEFRFDGSEVKIERNGDEVILRPSIAPSSGSALWDEIDLLRGEEQILYPVQPMIEELSFD